VKGLGFINYGPNQTLAREGELLAGSGDYIRVFDVSSFYLSCQLAFINI